MNLKDDIHYFLLRSAGTLLERTDEQVQAHISPGSRQPASLPDLNHLQTDNADDEDELTRFYSVAEVGARPKLSTDAGDSPPSTIRVLSSPYGNADVAPFPDYQWNQHLGLCSKGFVKSRATVFFVKSSAVYSIHDEESELPASLEASCSSGGKGLGSRG